MDLKEEKYYIIGFLTGSMMLWAIVYMFIRATSYILLYISSPALANEYNMHVENLLYHPVTLAGTGTVFGAAVCIYLRRREAVLGYLIACAMNLPWLLTVLSDYMFSLGIFFFFGALALFFVILYRGEWE